MIRDRKQRPGENFDSFYESVVDISDCLSTPLPETVLVEILLRNLLAEIQHEILNIPVYSVSQLRDICRRKEFFLLDMSRKQPGNKPFIRRRQVHEIVDDEVELTNETEVAAISLICWNCQKGGHRYQDCLKDRRIFCYRCVTSDVYKPNCSNCHGSKNFKSGVSESNSTSYTEESSDDSMAERETNLTEILTPPELKSFQKFY